MRYIGWITKDENEVWWVETPGYADTPRTKTQYFSPEEAIAWCDKLAGAKVQLLSTPLGYRVGVPE